jgi:hypothetical protein
MQDVSCCEQVPLQLGKVSFRTRAFLRVGLQA